MKRIFRLPIRRRSTIALVALVAATATCRDEPTAPPAPEVAPSEAAGPALSATLLSTPITHTLLTSGNHITNGSVFTTASIAPAPNALITVAVLGHNSSAAAPVPTISGGGMSAWTEVATIIFDPIAVPLKRMTIFRAMSTSPGSGPITITFNRSQSNAQWVVSQWEGVDISGVNGAGAIVQTGSSRADAVNGLALTLAPFGNENNVAYGVFGVPSKVPVVTPGAGFTEIAEHASGESPGSALQAEWTRNDNTIDASWANLRGGVLGIEIRAGEPAEPPPPPPPVSPAQSTVTADPTTVVVGAASTITVTVKDESGLPISGATVVLSAPGDENSLTQPTGPTDASGVATGTLTSTVAGTKTVSATADGTEITQTAAGACRRSPSP